MTILTPIDSETQAVPAATLANAVDAASDLRVSFEVFPAKNGVINPQMTEVLGELAALGPEFISVTYGAGGGTKTHTRDIAAAIAAGGKTAAAAHLTCVNASRAETQEVAQGYWNAGVRRIVALRGDMGKPGLPFAPHPDGYHSAAELVSGLKEVADFDITVAAYPEVHPDAVSQQSDIDNLKRKLDAGASRAITQFFFDADTYFRFLENVRGAGIDAPIIPGILPVANVAQVRKFAAACGAKIPAWMDDALDGLDTRPEARQLVAATLAADLCRALYAGGVRDFHFYTLNRAPLPIALCHLLRRRAPLVKQANQELL